MISKALFEERTTVKGDLESRKSKEANNLDYLTKSNVFSSTLLQALL
jgi:hypothetical protein